MHVPTMAAVLLATIALCTMPAGAQGRLGAEVSLLDGGSRESGRHLAGLEIDLEPGWKTYWRMPGEGGLSPRLDWSGSTNVADVALLWPAPRRLSDPYGDAIGYDRRVVLPALVTPLKAGEPMVLRVTGLVGVCEKVCVPLDVALAIELDPEARPGRIARASEAVPRAGDAAEAASIMIAREDTVLLVTVPVGVEDVFASGPGIANGLSYLETDEPGVHRIPLSGTPSGGAELTILGEDGAFTLPVPPS